MATRTPGAESGICSSTYWVHRSRSTSPSADVQDRAGARLLLAGLEPLLPRLKRIWADGTYGGEKLAKWCEEAGGFEVVAKQWIVERTFAWLCRNRRLAEDYERKVQTGETRVVVATPRLVLRRLARATWTLQNKRRDRPQSHTRLRVLQVERPSGRRAPR